MASVSHPPRALPAELGDSFSTRAARAHGVTARRLRAGDLEAPFAGVRLRAPQHEGLSREGEDGPLSIDRRMQAVIVRRAHAYAQIAPAGAFFVGQTALALHGLPLRRGADEAPLDVAVLSPQHAPRGRGVRGVKVAPRMVRLGTIGGLAVGDASSTWALAAASSSLRDLVVIGDAIVRIPRGDRGAPLPQRRLATLDELCAMANVPWRRNRELLLDALALVREGSMSPLETDMRLALTGAGLPEPELDVEIRTERGSLIGICDAVYPERRVIVEVEGHHHFTDDRQWRRDLEKYAALAADGWEVVRIAAHHLVRGGGAAAALVGAALARHPLA